jgi:hypothetical protein
LTRVYCIFSTTVAQTAHKKQESVAAADGVVELGQDGSFDAAASPDTKAVTSDVAPAAAAAAAAAKAPASTAGATEAASSDKPRKCCDVQFRKSLSN